MMSTEQENTQKYTKKFTQNNPVERYLRKFNNPIDQLRHQREISILNEYLYGNVFDCTIATGRFIDHLHTIEKYSGMDISDDFVSYVNTHYPHINVFKGDLTNRIPLDNEIFDCAICLRSLPGIGQTHHIIGEMRRIVKEGGLLVVDYGTKPKFYQSEYGDKVLSNEDIFDIIEQHDLQVMEILYLDGLFGYIKRSKYFFKASKLIFKLVSPNFWDKIDRFFSKFLYANQIIILSRQKT